MDNLIAEKTKQVEDIIIYSQNYDFDINCEDMLRLWYAKKKKFIDNFNGKTIWKSDKKFLVYLSDSEKDNIFEQFVDRISMRYSSIHFTNFIINNKRSFFDNEVTEIEYGFPATKGMRLSKSFKFFIEDEGELRWLQDYYSRCLQKIKLEGFIYLSVDPVDFLTLSENNANWRSCHSLDGDYRSGNLSYMLDNTTVIAYLASDEKVKLNNLPVSLPWFNKKWRMLLNCHNDNKILYFGRQYPFEDSHLMETVFAYFNRLSNYSFSSIRKLGFREIVIDLNGEKYKQRLSENALWIMDKVISVKDVVIEPKNTLNFNDLIYSSTYAPWAAIGENYNFNLEKVEDIKEEIAMTIGANILCPYCQEKFLTEGDTFVCEECRELLHLIKYEEDED